MIAKKKPLLFVSMLLIGSWNSVGIAAQPVAPQRTITETVNLIPRSDAEVILDKVEVKVEKVMSSNSIQSKSSASGDNFSISISGRHIAGGSPLAYEIEYDFDQGTYFTRLIAPDTAEAFTSNQALSATALGTGSENANCVSQKCWGKVRLQTIDPPYNPPFAVLAETTNVLKWTKSAARITYTSYKDLCWANPDTGVPFNTHWKTATACPKDAPFYETTRNKSVINKTNGDYINWNWGNKKVSTKAKHVIRIQAYHDSNTFDYHAIATHTGEDAVLLSQRVYLN